MFAASQLSNLCGIFTFFLRLLLQYNVGFCSSFLCTQLDESTDGGYTFFTLKMNAAVLFLLTHDLLWKYETIIQDLVRK